MNLWCIIWSIITGLCTTLGVNILQYASHLERSGRRTFPNWQKAIFYVLNILIMLGGTGAFLLATGNGPVSVAMPVVTAASLLANMFVQTCLGIERYTKSMRVGTLVLTFAVICLVDVGPEDQKYADPLALLETPAGLVVSGLQLLLLALGFVLIAIMRQAPPDSMAKIGAYGIVVATSTAIGASIGKVMQLDLSTGAKIVCLGIYLISGIISFGMAAVAATCCDASVYLPVRACLQLLVNAATGMWIWQDYNVMAGADQYVAYISVYVLIVLGVYSVSSYDMFPLDVVGRSFLEATGKDMPFDAAVSKCVRTWNEENGNDEESLSAFHDMLKCGLDTQNVDQYALLDLTMRLMEKHKENAPSTDVKSWLNENVQQVQDYYREVGGSFQARSTDVEMPRSWQDAVDGNDGRPLTG